MERNTDKISYEVPIEVIEAIHRFVGGRVRNWHVVSAAMLTFVEASQDTREDALRRISTASFPGNKSFAELFAHIEASAIPGQPESETPSKPAGGKAVKMAAKDAGNKGIKR